MARALPVTRGCGSRIAGGVYLETGLGPGGAPIEDFLIDPPITDVPADWLLPHRTPIMFERDGIWHVVIWVGEQYYPSLWDYVEEVRVAGSSRRVPATFDFSKLGPGSRQYFVHIRADVAVDYEDQRFTTNLYPAVDPHCPIKVHDPQIYPKADPDGREHCLGLAKYIREETPAGYKEEAITPHSLQRTLPCGRQYGVYSRPAGVLLPTNPGVFLSLPLTGIAMVKDGDGSVKEDVVARVAQSKTDAYIVDK